MSVSDHDGTRTQTTRQPAAPLLEPVPLSRPTFLNVPRCEDVQDLAALGAEVAVIGVPFGMHYDMLASRETAATGPAAIREQSLRFVQSLGHYDYDFGGPTLADRAPVIVDCGDVAMTPGDYAGNAAATTAAINAIIDAGVVPVVFGGSHAVTIPVMAAYAGRQPMGVVQLDAHIDFRDEVDGNRDGWSSPMRRAVELDSVTGLTQIGLRSVGSARQEEVDLARELGVVQITARELHAEGAEAALARVPSAERFYITIDADGFDPTLAPAVGVPSFGGITYQEAVTLLQGVAQRGQIVGYDFVVVSPGLDIGHRTAYLAARLTYVLIGALAHSGQIGRSSVSART